MNLPNKLTILRLILVPFMVLSFYMTALNPLVMPIITVAIFLIASLTDFLDGYIARKHNLVTNFGKFMDPLADKALVLTALILIVDNKLIVFPYLGSICLIIMLIRELVVSGIRLIGASKGVVIAADKLGKLKTVTQIIAIPLILIVPCIYVIAMNGIQLGQMYWVGIFQWLMYIGVGMLVISTVITIISGISYVVKNKAVFKDDEEEPCQDNQADEECEEVVEADDIIEVGEVPTEIVDIIE